MDVAAHIRETVGIRSEAGGADKTAYARDLWPRNLIDVRRGRATEHAPAAVVWPERAEHVAELIAVARREGWKLVPFGAGSGVCGAIRPSDRTVVVDMKRMADWSVDAEAPWIDAGPGAIGITLEEDLARRGYTIGHFPSSILCSTVGGWIAARGAGQCSGSYGKIEDMVVDLDCVLGTGELVTLRRRDLGPDLTPLMIGSEGTLGFVTRAKLRLHPAPRARAFAAFAFPDCESGWEAMRELFQTGLRPAVSRLYDPIDSFLMKQGSVRPSRSPRKKRSGSGNSGAARALLRIPGALNAAIEAAEGNLLGEATLILVFEGDSETVHADSARAIDICTRSGARHLGEGLGRKWLEHRYSVSYRQSAVFRMGAFSDTMEVAAPWSRLKQLYDDVRAALGEHVLVMAHLSHAYPDGCSIYFSFAGAAGSDEEALAKYDRAWAAALPAAIEAGGTLSHHHGVGRSKAPQLGSELGFGIEVVRRLMRACDPDSLLNPGALANRNDDGRIDPEAAGSVPAAGTLDEHSLVYTAAGTDTLGAVRARLAERGLELAPEADGGATVAAWVADGMPGAPDRWSDPVDQTLVGAFVRLADGNGLPIRPAPRRAVGPDLLALVRGAGDRCGTVERACLRVHRRGDSARTLPYAGPRNPQADEAERDIADRVLAAAGGR